MLVVVLADAPITKLFTAEYTPENNIKPSTTTAVAAAVANADSDKTGDAHKNEKGNTAATTSTTPVGAGVSGLMDNDGTATSKVISSDCDSASTSTAKLIYDEVSKCNPECLCLHFAYQTGNCWVVYISFYI